MKKAAVEPSKGRIKYRCPKIIFVGGPLTVPARIHDLMPNMA